MVNYKLGNHLSTSFFLQQDQTELLQEESEERLESYTILCDVINFTFTRLSDVFFFKFQCLVYGTRLLQCYGSVVISMVRFALDAHLSLSIL